MDAQAEINAETNKDFIPFIHVVQERVKKAGQTNGKNVEVGKVGYLVPTLQRQNSRLNE